VSVAIRYAGKIDGWDRTRPEGLEVTIVLDLPGDVSHLPIGAPVVLEAPATDDNDPRDDLLAACEAVLPWVATAIAYRDPIHPDAVKNHAADLKQFVAAIAKAKGGGE